MRPFWSHRLVVGVDDASAQARMGKDSVRRRARVAFHQMLPNKKLRNINPTDRRAIDIVAYSLPLHQEVPLAGDATMASPLTRSGRPQGRTALCPARCPTISRLQE